MYVIMHVFVGIVLFCSFQSGAVILDVYSSTTFYSIWLWGLFMLSDSGICKLWPLGHILLVLRVYRLLELRTVFALVKNSKINKIKAGDMTEAICGQWCSKHILSGPLQKKFDSFCSYVLSGLFLFLYPSKTHLKNSLPNFMKNLLRILNESTLNL